MRGGEYHAMEYATLADYEDVLDHFTNMATVSECTDLACPITRDMTLDHFMLTASGHTYEVECHPEHLRDIHDDCVSQIHVPRTDTTINAAVDKRVTHKRAYRTTAEFREKQAAYNKAYRGTPENKKKFAEYRKTYRETPKYKEKAAAYNRARREARRAANIKTRRERDESKQNDCH